MSRMTKMYLSDLPRFSLSQIELRNTSIKYAQSMRHQTNLAAIIEASINRIFSGHCDYRNQQICVNIVHPDGVQETRCLPCRPDLTIGRSNRNDITLNCNQISSVHCRIERGDHSISITDLGSKNGTSLNGNRILPFSRQLYSGQVISIGKLILTLQVTPIADSVQKEIYVWTSHYPERVNSQEKMHSFKLRDTRTGSRYTFYSTSQSLLDFSLFYLGLDLAEDIKDQLHPDIQQDLIIPFIERLLSELNHSCGSDFEWISMGQMTDLEDMEFICSTSIKAFGLSGRIPIWISGETLKSLPANEYNQLSINRNNSIVYHEMKLAFRVVVSEHILSTQDLEYIATGDIILLHQEGAGDARGANPRSVYCIPFGADSSCYHFKSDYMCQSNELCIVWSGFKSTKGEIMNQEFNREDNGHKFSDQFCETLQIDALEVPAVKATLELGRFDLSVGELSRMAPGQIVKTGISSDQDVLLVVKDEVLVGGRLILVENELAFEVLWKK